VLALLVAYGITLFVQARSLMRQASQAQTSLSSFTATAKKAVASGDAQQLAALRSNSDLKQAQTSLSAADSTLSGPLWSPLTLLPGYGADVTEVRGLVHAGNEVANSTVPAYLSALTTLTNSKLTNNGTINTKVLSQVRSTLSPATATLGRAAGQVADLPHGSISGVSLVRSKASSALTKASTAAQTGSKALDLLVRLVGSSKQLDYVITGTTPAELRSSTGLTGSIGLLKVGKGKLSIGSFSPNRTFLSQGPILQSQEATSIFSIPNVVYSFDVRDVGVDPDFSGVAQSLMTAWTGSEAGKGTDPQGAIVVDPVFVQELIKLTGDVTLPDGTVLTGQNAADYLSNGVYKSYPNSNDQQDAILASAVALTADRLMGDLNGKTMVGLVKDLPSLIRSRHVLMYSTDAATQRLVSALGLTPSPQRSSSKPVLGLYIDSYNSSKMDFYNERTVRVRQTAGPTTNGVRGRRTYTVSLRIANTLPTSQVASTPGYILGGNGRKDALTEFLLVYAPRGGTVKATTAPTGFTLFTWTGKKLQRTAYEIGSEQSSTYIFTVTTSPDATHGLTLDQSPACR
jgi:hypothetical protein